MQNASKLTSCAREFNLKIMFVHLGAICLDFINDLHVIIHPFPPITHFCLPSLFAYTFSTARLRKRHLTQPFFYHYVQCLFCFFNDVLIRPFKWTQIKTFKKMVTNGVDASPFHSQHALNLPWTFFGTGLRLHETFF